MEVKLQVVLLLLFVHYSLQYPTTWTDLSKPLSGTDDLIVPTQNSGVWKFSVNNTPLNVSSSSGPSAERLDLLREDSAGPEQSAPSVVCKENTYLSPKGVCRPCRQCLGGRVLSPCSVNKNTVCNFAGKGRDKLLLTCIKLANNNRVKRTRWGPWKWRHCFPALVRRLKEQGKVAMAKHVKAITKRSSERPSPPEKDKFIETQVEPQDTDMKQQNQSQESDHSLYNRQGANKPTNDDSDSSNDDYGSSYPNLFDIQVQRRPKRPKTPFDVSPTTSNVDAGGYVPNLLSPGTAEDSAKTSNLSKKGGIGDWVFATIGVTVVVVAVSVFLLSYVYRARLGQNAQRKQQSGKKEAERADNLLSIDCYAGDTLSSREDFEEIPMHARKEANYSENESSDNDGGHSDSEPDRRRRRAAAERGCSPRSQLLSRCLSSPLEDEDRARAESSGSIYSAVKNDGNKLRGGNGDFHRRYVDNPYVCNDLEMDDATAQSPGSSRRRGYTKSRPVGQPPRALNLTSTSSEGGWNGSSASSTTSHHSARSYISIPPTSPSDNYIEAGSDCLSLRSEKSSPPIKMEWLTKSFKLDHKNELSAYQASTGVQTEDTVAPPTTLTVLGTPWQFGGAFTNQGGVLQARGSDVRLSVPGGAVPRGQAMDIYGAVFTDTADIRKKLEFPSAESLVTPVVEYLALPGSNFSRPVHLHLPHALPAEFDEGSIKVYTFSVDELGRVTTSCVPYKGQNTAAVNEEAHWEKGPDGSKILITTSHFSGYFCTLCNSTSLPSICTMVFGSHVQISEHRREIRVILYIWDRRLTIRDYLERFRKEESEVDRQLLTDMQVPLLNDASSDSRLVMRMEVMGSEEERQCWRHVARPGGSRLLFKPLQVRRLSEIVQCCRQTDPIRVEWAIENCPELPAGPVFQCCIDIMHVPESTCDYETALSEDLDDLMRTFYVRDLKVMPRQEAGPAQEFKFERTNLQRTLSQTLDLKQTEEMCLEFGITSKDIGNFRKKFSTESEVQVGLVEECLRRLGPEKFVSQLPSILDRLHLSHLLKAVGSGGETAIPKKLAVEASPPPKLPKSPGDVPSGPENSVTSPKSVAENSLKLNEYKCNSNDNNQVSPKSCNEKDNNCSGNQTRLKSCNVDGHKSSGDQTNPKSCNLNGHQQQQQRPVLHQQASARNDDTFVPGTPQHCVGRVGGGGAAAAAAAAAAISSSFNSAQAMPSVDPTYSISSRAPTSLNNNNSNNISSSSSSGHHHHQHQQHHTTATNNKLSSSSGYESVYPQGTLSSTDNISLTHNNLRSFHEVSVLAHADTLEYPKSSVQVPDSALASHAGSVGDGQAYPEITEEAWKSTAGPQAFAEPEVRDNRSSGHTQDKDETSKKEVYGIQTVV